MPVQTKSINHPLLFFLFFLCSKPAHRKAIIHLGNRPYFAFVSDNKLKVSGSL